MPAADYDAPRCPPWCVDPEPTRHGHASTEWHHPAEKDALRQEVAAVVYRELGDMVNRDYLIDALMSVIEHRVFPPGVT